jgi:hypothetical protein
MFTYPITPSPILPEKVDLKQPPLGRLCHLYHQKEEGKTKEETFLNSVDQSLEQKVTFFKFEESVYSKSA